MHTFQAIKISENIYWVGAIDWELRNFHGYATTRGSTYNAFLILGSEPILVDTVKEHFYDEMLARISSVIDPNKIKYLISNHSEMDHSGCLPKVLDTFKGLEKIFASKAGAEALRDHFHLPREITAIVNGETLNLGNIALKCFETRMLHWPDSMFTYCANDRVLFSQDGFGMHFATTELYADENDAGVLYQEAAKYYANILLPYSPLVTKTLEKLPQLQLDIQIIAPDHGPLWRTKQDIAGIIANWERWAKQKYYPKALIIYDTMWNSTAKMAATIADGLRGHDIEVKVLNLSTCSRSEVAAEVLECGALLVGSPTLNQEIFPTVADNLCYLHGLKPKNLIGQAFSSYGWGGEAQNILVDKLKGMGIELISDGVKSKYVPTTEVLQKCFSLGKEVGAALKTKLVSN